MHDIFNLKKEINRLNNRGDNLNLLGAIQLNDDIWGPYKLYFESDGQFLSISASVDIVEMHQFNTIEELVNDIDLFYQNSVFVKGDASCKINKTNPIVAMMNNGGNFDLDCAVWNDDFLIVKKQTSNLYALFLSDEFYETTPSHFLDYMMDKISLYSGVKINDFERLFMLGYDMGQVNEIIKSKAIYDIEPLVNKNTPEELMEKYNRALKKMEPSDRDAFRKCVLLECSFDFLTDERFNEDQKDVIKQYLSLNVRYDERITPDFSADKMVHVYNLLIKNPRCEGFKPEHSIKRLFCMARKEYNCIADLITDDFDDDKLDIYLYNLRERKIADFETINLVRKYVSDEYDKEQINLIFDLIENYTDKKIIDFIAKNGYSAEQMYAIKQSLTVLDFEQLDWVTPEYSGNEILEISKRIITGQNYKKLLKNKEKSEDKKSLEDIISEKFLQFKNNFKREDHEEDLEK